MSLSELTQGARPRFIGSLTGTLGQNASGAPEVSTTGLLERPREPGRFPALPAAGGGGGGFGAAPVPVFPTTPVAQAVSIGGSAEQDFGTFLAESLGVLGRPLKIVADMFAQLDRPQQFLFAALTRGIESGSIWEGIQAGTTAFLFRRPDGMLRPKDRVDVDEVIEAVGSRYFGYEGAAKDIPVLPRVALQASLIVGADPLVLFPGVWITKGGRAITHFATAVRSTYASQLVLSKGAGGHLKSAAAALNDFRIERFLKDVGKREGDTNLWDVVLEPITAVVKSRDELDALRDYMTGIAVETSAARDLTELVRRGIVDPEAAKELIGRGLAELTPETAESIQQQLLRVLTQRRQEGALVRRLIVTGPPRRGHRPRAVTLEDAASDELLRPFVTGQLINRLGFLPSSAMDVNTARAAARMIRKKGLFGETAEIRADAFLKGLRNAPDAYVPKSTGRAFRAAMKGAAGSGRFIVDEAVAFELQNHFVRAGLTLESGRRLAKLAAGLEKPFVGTEIPAEIAHPEVVTQLMDGSPGARELNILSFFMDPKAVLPEPVWSSLKYGEDAGIAHNNVMVDALSEVLELRGKAVQQGSRESRMVGYALSDVNTENSKLHVDSFFYGKSSEDVRKLIATTDPELHQIVQAVRGFFIGSRQAMIRRGVRGFEKLADDAPIEHYFPRMYPGFKDAIAEAVADGRISAADAEKLLARGGDAIPPLEMEFVDRSQVYFRHLLSRGDQVAAKFDTDATLALRSYIAGLNRKLWMEPAIATANRLGAELPGTQKQYLKMLLHRMMGFPIGEEELLNNLANTVRARFGFEPTFKPATRASLAITRQFYRGLLGGNTGFFLKNLTQGINTATKQGPLGALQGAAMFVTNPKMPNGQRFRELAENQNMLRNFNDILEKGSFARGSKKLSSRMDSILFAPATFSEKFNRGMALAAGMSQKLEESKFDTLSQMFKASPKEFAEAVEYGHAIANETQFIYGLVGRSPIAGSPLGRLGLQFFSWPIKQVEFLKTGMREEGMSFFLRYVTMAGTVSKLAEHAEVDAANFLGFGFWPGQASPSVQILGHMIGAVESQAVDGDTETSRRHMEEVVNGLQNLIPAFLEMERLVESTAEIESGVQRGFRGRFSRRTDDPDRQQELSEILDVSLNPLAEALRIPFLERGVSGEQFVKLVGLPGIRRNQFRELVHKMELESKKEDRKARDLLDKYVDRYFSGDFVGAREVMIEARDVGLPITPDMVKSEIHNRRTPSLERILENTRRAARTRVLERARDTNPDLVAEAIGDIGVPSDPLGGTR